MKKLLKIFLIILLSTVFSGFAISSTIKAKSNHLTHLHSESSYQKAWAELNNAIVEYKNDDYTRVDCLTDIHAVEFDFANKWAESVGQALYYQHKTNKKGKVVLIIEYPEKQMVYLNRVKALSRVHGFDVDYVTPDILCLDQNGRCKYKTCKCHKQ